MPVFCHCACFFSEIVDTKDTILKMEIKRLVIIIYLLRNFICDVDLAPLCGRFHQKQNRGGRPRPKKL